MIIKNSVIKELRYQKEWGRNKKRRSRVWDKHNQSGEQHYCCWKILLNYIVEQKHKLTKKDISSMKTSQFYHTLLHYFSRQSKVHNIHKMHCNCSCYLNYHSLKYFSCGFISSLQCAFSSQLLFSLIEYLFYGCLADTPVTGSTYLQN